MIDGLRDINAIPVLADAIGLLLLWVFVASVGIIAWALQL